MHSSVFVPHIQTLLLAALIAGCSPGGSTTYGGKSPVLASGEKGDASPTPTPSPTPTELEATYDSINKHIFSRRCVGCHSEGGRADHIPLGTYVEIMESPRELVIPENPDESGIVLAVERQDEKRMPPPPRNELTDEEKLVIRKWIADGALNN